MYIYIVENKPGRQYVGITTNLVRMVKKQRSGKYRYTNGDNNDWKVVYYWTVANFIYASKFKRLIKMKQHDPNWVYWLRWLVVQHPEWDCWIENKIRGFQTTSREYERQFELYGPLALS